MQKPSIKEVVVVEGKSDVDKLNNLFNVKTITTNGSQISQKTLNLIKKAHEQFGVILFLDPDYQGERIRKIVNDYLRTEVKNAFVSQKSMLKNKLKIGIAEATNEAIIKALNSVSTFNWNASESLSWKEYLELDFNSKQKRIDLCNLLNISYCNHKQLFKRLNLLQKNKIEIMQLMEKIKNEIK